MKKFVISSAILAVFVFGAQASEATTYRAISGHIVKTGTASASTHGPAQYRYRPPVGYRMNRPVVLTGGVNYIDKEIGSGRVKQVVQVGPTPVYYSPYIY